MATLIELALKEVSEGVRVARTAADVDHLKDDLFEYLNHLDMPEKYPNPEGMDINRLTNRVIKLIEHCESVEHNLKPVSNWVAALIEEAAKRQGGE